MAAAIQDLERFVGDALAKGQTRDAIAATLHAAGWAPEQVHHAMGAWADVDFPVPVPRPRPYLSAREAFLYLVLFATLYLSAWHLGSLLFDLVTRALPDPADAEWVADRVGDSIRWSIASVAIAFPVFLFVARLLSRELAANPEKRLSPVRRWLTYLTLSIAAAVLIGDMIALVDGLLAGELTLRFLLKALVAAMIAGAIFAWYLVDVRREERDPAVASRGRTLLVVASVAVVATSVAALWVLGLPGDQRLVRMDERRERDLAAIDGEIRSFHAVEKRLPPDLATLAARPGTGLAVADPADGTRYEYVVVDARRFRLCAAFATDSTARRIVRRGFDRAWAHGVGRTCFDRRVGADD